MDKLRFYICLLVILMVGLPSFTFSQSPSQLFQQGLLKENGEGDLEAAVTIYEKIVADATADRSLRAKAQLHIGMCYEKLGKPETQKAYERVLQDYADQPEAARLAQEALARLSPKNDEQDGQLNLRFVMGGLHEKGIREWALSLSPEGDRVAYRVRKADRYELWVSDFAGFHARLLTSDGWPDRPSWSPDGNFLVYTAQRTDSLSTLWVISLEDSTERQLTKLESRVPAWSPDGKTIAFAGDANEGGLYVISAAGGTPQFLTEAGPKYGYHWSADSKKIAFRRIGAGGNRDVSYYDLEQGRRIRITSDPAVDNPAGWSPDGREAYFFSNRKGNFQLWKVHLSEQTGEPVGSPTQVTDVQDVDVVYAVQTADCRKMAVQLKKNTDRLGVVAANGEKVVKILREGYQPQWLDEQTLLIGTADGNLATLILNRNETKKLTNQGNIISGLVSPDRLSVAFVAIDTARTKPELLGKRTESMWGGGTWTRGIVKNVYVMPVSGGAERKLLQVDGQGGIHAWSPDSRQLVVINDDKLVVVAATGGEPEVLATEQNFDGGLQWSLDGKRVLYTAYNPGPQSDIFAIDIAGGEPMNLTEDPKHYHCPPFSCSPDGKKVAYTKIEDDGDQHLWRFDLETGRKESLNTIAYNPVWSPDGNRIAFWSWRGEHICDIWALDVNTGQFQQITDDPDDKEDLAWSPDGNFIAFEITREDRQLWLMDLQ